ncbi:MAG: hypothetical protein ACR2RV_27100 [Verrucomicrobiales bacterium]
MLILPCLSVAVVLSSSCSSKDDQPGRMTDTSAVVGSNVSGVSSGESVAIGSVLSHSMGYGGYGYGGSAYFGPRFSGYDAVVRKP